MTHNAHDDARDLVVLDVTKEDKEEEDTGTELVLLLCTFDRALPMAPTTRMMMFVCSYSLKRDLVVLVVVVVLFVVHSAASKKKSAPIPFSLIGNPTCFAGV